MRTARFGSHLCLSARMPLCTHPSPCPYLHSPVRTPLVHTFLSIPPIHTSCSPRSSVHNQPPSTQVHAGIHTLPKYMLGYTPPEDRMTDRRIWKHYLPATSYGVGNNYKESWTLFYCLTFLCYDVFEDLSRFTSSMYLWKPDRNSLVEVLSPGIMVVLVLIARFVKYNFKLCTYTAWIGRN